MPNTLPTRGTSTFIGLIRSALVAGRYADGQYLPSVRRLADEYALAPETVRRGLIHLKAEGLLKAHPRRGFLVTASPHTEAIHAPIAYITDYSPDLNDAQPVNWALDRVLRDVAGANGWPTLGIHAGGCERGRLAEQLKSGRAWGVVLDTLDENLLAQVQASGLPVVMINAWIEGADVDVVLQDNYLGGYLAAKQLVEAGAKRIGWIGPLARYCHSRERFAGMVAGLAACGRHIDFRFVIDTDQDTVHERNLAAIRGLFQSSERPDGVLNLWGDFASDVTGIAAAAGLRIGTDLKIVGWTVEELYASRHHKLYDAAAMPPAIVWKARAMIEAALELLEMRRSGKAGERRRVLIPTRLKCGGSAKEK